MAWQTPKEDWNSSDQGVEGDDFNRMEGNSQFLYENTIIKVGTTELHPTVAGATTGPYPAESNPASIYKQGERINFIVDADISSWRIDGKAGVLTLEMSGPSPIGFPIETKPLSSVGYATVYLNTESPSGQADVILLAFLEVVSETATHWRGKISFYENTTTPTVFSTSTIQGEDIARMNAFQLSWYVPEPTP